MKNDKNSFFFILIDVSLNNRLFNQLLICQLPICHVIHCVSLMIVNWQVLDNKTKPGPSFQLNSVSMITVHICYCEAKLSNLKLKTWPEQLLGYLLFDIELPNRFQRSVSK